MHTIAALVLAATTVQLPQPSPGVTVAHDLGISRVTVAYHRPAVKGRRIWGELVPYDKVWRLGANEATTIELSHPAKVAGRDVPPGKYALFAIPSANEWTLILNKKNQQWGAYFYDAKDDLLRFTVKPEAAEFREWFDIDLAPVSDREMRVNVMWDKVRVPFSIEFDTKNLVWSQIESALAKAGTTADDWETWHKAARWALDNNERLDEALTWVDKAMAKESFWNYELKGRILHQMGRTAEAIPLMLKARELAAGKAPKEWLEGVDKTIASWR